MTTYKLKDMDSLLKKKRKTFEKIVYILALSEKKKLTTREIYRKGRELFLDEFPKNRITVLRYLNTMLYYGIVEKDGWYWYLKDPQIYIGKIVANIDIENLKEALKFEDGHPYCSILAYPEIAFYEVSPFLEEYFKKEIKGIVKKFLTTYEKLRKLNKKAIQRYYSDFEEELLKDSQLSEFDKHVIRVVFHIFKMHYAREVLGDLVSDGTIKLAFPETWKENYELTPEEISLIDDYRIQVLPKDFDCIVPYFVLDENNEIKINTSMVIPIAKILQKHFYKNKNLNEIIHKVKNYRVKKVVIEKLGRLIPKFCTAFLLSFITNFNPIIVINPLRRNMIVKDRNKFFKFDDELNKFFRPLYKYFIEDDHYIGF